MAEEITAKITDQDAMLQRYETFLHREPLNEELAAVQRGENPFAAEVALPQPATAGGGAVEGVPIRQGELTRADRVALRELRQSEGYPILQGMLKKRFQQIEKRAITISKVDPLQNRDVIAKEWSYLGALEQVIMDIGVMVDEELKILWEQEK